MKLQIMIQLTSIKTQARENESNGKLTPVLAQQSSDTWT